MKTTFLTTILALTSTSLAASLPPRQATDLVDCTCQRMQNTGTLEREFARAICTSDNPDYSGEFCRNLPAANKYTDTACVTAMGSWYTDSIKAEGAVWKAFCRAPGLS